mgnify:CR=1 FL=1|jgi:hypothetical protein
MSNAKKRKDAPISTTTFRPPTKNTNRTVPLPKFTYLFNEKETTALDTVFAHLFEKLTEESVKIDH